MLAREAKRRRSEADFLITEAEPTCSQVVAVNLSKLVAGRAMGTGERRFTSRILFENSRLGSIGKSEQSPLPFG